MSRESFFDAYACREMAKRLAAQVGSSHEICGRCVEVCRFRKKYLRRSGVR